MAASRGLSYGSVEPHVALALDAVNKKSPWVLIQETGAEHFQQMGLSVYIHSPWIPSLLASRKKYKVPSAQAGLFQLGSQICKYTTVNRQVCTLF